MKTKRILMSLVGVVICAVSVGIFKIAALGVDPFQTFLGGLDQLLPIPFGTLSVLLNVVLLSFSLLVDRHNIGIATFLNLFLLGYIIQFTYEFLQTVLPDPSMPVRFLCLAVGLVLLCFSSSLYMTADLGVSTYDAVAIVMANKWKLAPFRFCRIATDLVCVIAGVGIFLAGGGTVAKVPTIAGIGTILTAFCMGPLIEVFNEKISRPMLGIGKEGV
ncbi:MAG: hypothetical protein J6B10_07285 [Lachnospiraceae bacterium]|nr:hypothetical protein [Lachnospiraceae bacterium]